MEALKSHSQGGILGLWPYRSTKTEVLGGDSGRKNWSVCAGSTQGLIFGRISAFGKIWAALMEGCRRALKIK